MTTPQPPVPENGEDRGVAPPAAAAGTASGTAAGTAAGTAPGTASGTASGTAPEADRVGTLRGASPVQIDPRRLGQIAIGVVLVTLAVLVVVLSVAGLHSNDQIDRLHDDGVPVTVTATGCLGLLGGSGSNAAGYTCHGTYTLDGHRYTVQLPGTDFHRPGSMIPSVAVRGDPALVSPVYIVDTQHSSASVFILPAVLLVVLLVLVGVIVLRRRARHRSADSA
jgi:hypothetical protein